MDLRARLVRAVSSADVILELESLTQGLSADLATVRTLLRFLEDHPTLDVGSPGPIVHFVETLHGSGYEAELVESILRRPTPHTIWMLNRLINGTKAVDERERMIATMRVAMSHREVDDETKRLAAHFVERLGLSFGP